MGGPTGVGNSGVRLEGLGHIGLGLGDELSQLGDLANFLEGADLVLLVTVDGHTGGIIAAVFEAGQSCGAG